jgi:GNAT superfamily N-acetyltransferase
MTALTAPLEGGCDCRRVRYRLDAAPLVVHCCHCRWCQRESGAAFALNAMIESDRVTELGVAPQLVDTPSESGAGQQIARCPHCRVAVWSHYAGAGPVTKFVRVGTLDTPDALPPDVHIYTASRQPWVVVPPGMPAFEAYYDREQVWSAASLARRAALLPRIEAHRAAAAAAAAARAPVDPATVSLREIDADTLLPVLRLAVADGQKGYVASNAVSLAQALFAPQAWYRAIYAGETLAGFVMLDDESLLSPPPPAPAIGVWRLMIDARHQRRGIGRAALLQVIAHARAKGVAETLTLSYVPGPGGPEPFYLGLGFRPTGRIDDGEVVLALPLRPGPA